MIEVNGKFNSAKIYTDTVDGKAIAQLTAPTTYVVGFFCTKILHAKP